MNNTIDSIPLYAIQDYYAGAPLSVFFNFITIGIAIFIIILIWRTKPRLHTINHLLICNTSDMSCRWRAFFTYIGIAGELYTYMLQAISRLFFSTLSTKYRWLITFKTHYIFIFIQWFIVVLITSNDLITKDINFISTRLCEIPMISKLHVTFAIFTYYVIPLVITVSIYIYIFYKVKQAKKNATTITNSLNSQKRDLQLLRNVLIYISVYLLGGFPSLVFYMTHKKLPYFINLVTVPATVATSKLTITLLDREIHLVIKSILCRTQTTPVKPFDNRFITKRTQINTNHLQIHVTS